MFIKKCLVLLAMVSFAFLKGFAHEGHDKMPGALSAPHGGQVKGTDHLYIELISDAEGIKLYPLTHEMKPIPLDQLKLEGTFRLPKGKKSDTLVLKKGSDYFEAKVQAKGSHRYQVDLKVTFMKATDSLSFNVEPQ